MKRRKILAVIMALCMAASLTACGPFKLKINNNKESETTVSETAETDARDATDGSIPDIDVFATEATDNTEETWTCSKGHSGNTGKFCADCGEPKSDGGESKSDGSEETWTCSQGHSGNTGKFCAECGEPQEGPAETTTEATTEATTAAETTVAETTAAETTAEETTAETAAQSSNSGWVNFTDMHFYVNGKKYTLGQTTLQEMIDDGVPFDKDSIADAGNNINGNHQSSNFKIKLDKYRSAGVSVINDSKDNKKMNECIINSISLYAIKDQKNEKVVTFDFPLDITQEDLIAAAGKPDDDNYRHYESDDKKFISDTYHYRGERGKYFNTSSYIFEFTNGEFSSVDITYFP